MDTNYFVCTLGEAAQAGISRPFTDVAGLIEEQAKQRPQAAAIGLLTGLESSSEQKLKANVLSFADVKQIACHAARNVAKRLLETKASVGILADSSPDFLFTWLACVWLGHPVLLIAPQCSAKAIAHLCQACQVSILFVDAKHESLANSACEVSTSAGTNNLSFEFLPTIELSSTSSEAVSDDISRQEVAPDEIAYLHHTSGTSSGLPKSIPQTHHGAVGVLPALDGQNEATFTTTPLYHGGPADIFRAWSSGALIWLFPSNLLPITAKNVVRCLGDVKAVEAPQGTSIPPIRYFTSVPYILQMMAADESGLKWLKDMDLVGVGGAALPPDVGNQLVKQNVNLVSRFGSAECGFLLSSHRDYDKDKEWQYLRVSENSTQLEFEPRAEGLHELVIKAQWPHMAKRNREDGSYATSDLFEKHPKIQNGYRYHSRADAQLTLITGKKFDPSPIEAAIVSKSSMLCDVLVFGEGKQYPGALLFRSKEAKDTTDANILNDVSPIIERLNADSQSHTRIPRNMLIVMPFDSTPLEKSSKGTIMRKIAVEHYGSTIEKAYASVQVDGNKISDAQVPQALLDLVKSIVGEDQSTELTKDADLFSHGVDSVACVQIRHALALFVPKDTKLPLTVVEDSMTVAGLSEFILSLRQGKAAKVKDSHSQQILQHVNQYTRLDDERPVETITNGFTTIVEAPGKKIILTGPTGSLGSHVLYRLLQRADISHIYLLVRGASPQAAHERVTKALPSRKLAVPEDFDQKVTVLQCKLSEPDLGIPFQDYDTLQNEIDMVFHLAWPVNFLLSLQSFTSHFAAIQNLLNLCLSSTKLRTPRLVFCSSVAAVSNYSSLYSDHDIPENVVPSLTASGSTGYALSKLTAELILARAATQSKSLRNRITIVRVGQLSADSNTGIWNASEAYPQIFASAKITGGVLPDLGPEEILTWIPVNVAGRAFVEAGMHEPSDIGNMPTEHVRHKLKEPYNPVAVIGLEGDRPIEVDGSAVKVLHLVNPENESTFTDFLQSLLKAQARSNRERPLELVPSQEWLQKLEGNQTRGDAGTETQSLLRLLPFWKQAYSERKPSSQDTGSRKQDQQELVFDIHNSLVAMPSLTYWLGQSTIEGRKTPKGSEGEVDNELLKQDYVMKIWEWVEENVPAPQDAAPRA